MIIKDNMANMCAKVTSTYIEFTLAFGPKPEFSFSFKSDFYCCICGQPLNDRQDLFVKIRDNDSEETLRIVPVHSGNCDNTLCKQESAKGNNTNSCFNFYSFGNDKELEKYLVTGEV